MAVCGIPIVDFEPCGLQKQECSREDLALIGKQLVDAFVEVGFVYLKNHGVADSYIQDVHGVTDKFFTRPEEEKAPYAKRGLENFGWFGVGKENASGVPNSPPDYKEAFNANGSTFIREKGDWPDDIAPGFSHAIKDFMECGRRLTLRVLHALAIGLGLKDEYFFNKCHSQMHTVKCWTSARTVYYPPPKNGLQHGQIRCGEHSDTTAITFVFQDEVGGLQIKAADGTYVDATPIKETVVVNVGDILEFWTNQYLKSTKHRVVFKESELENNQLRRTIAYFAIPNNDAIINKPLVYNDESRNKAMESHIPLTTEKWVKEKLESFWEPLLDG